jgi:hypothetical protein
VQPFEREGWAATVANETLDARPVLALDAHRGVDAEPARALPGEHAGGIELVEESLATEAAEDVLLDDRLHVGDAIGRQVIGLVKLDLAVVGLVEHAVEMLTRDQMSSTLQGHTGPPPSPRHEMPPYAHLCRSSRRRYRAAVVILLAWGPLEIGSPWRAFMGKALRGRELHAHIRKRDRAALGRSYLDVAC